MGLIRPEVPKWPKVAASISMRVEINEINDIGRFKEANKMYQ